MTISSLDESLTLIISPGNMSIDAALAGMLR